RGPEGQGSGPRRPPGARGPTKRACQEPSQRARSRRPPRMNDRSAPPATPLPDLSAAPRTRLQTSWGTVLFVDAAAGELRHRPADKHPTNVVFVADPVTAQSRGWLACERDGRLEPIRCQADGSWTAAADAEDDLAPTRLEVIRHRPDAIRLRAGGHYLCA